MSTSDPDDPSPDGSAGADDSREEAERPPEPRRAGTPFPVTLFAEPPVVLTDPPAILGGASHTW